MGFNWPSKVMADSRVKTQGKLGKRENQSHLPNRPASLGNQSKRATTTPIGGDEAVKPWGSRYNGVGGKAEWEEIDIPHLMDPLTSEENMFNRLYFHKSLSCLKLWIFKLNCLY